MVLLDSTHEDVWLRFQEALTPAQWGRVRSAHCHQPEVARRVPGNGALVYRPVGGRRDHWSGTAVESERSAPPDAARRSGPRHRLCRAVSWLAKRQDGRDHDRAAGGSRRARPQRALRHRYQERAQYSPGPAGAGHRGDPGGGRGGAQPKHLGPSTVIPVPWDSGPPKTAFSCLPPVPRADLAGRLRSRVRVTGTTPHGTVRRIPRGQRRCFELDLLRQCQGAQAIRDFTQAMRSDSAICHPRPGAFPDHFAPIVRNGAEGASCSWRAGAFARRSTSRGRTGTPASRISAMSPRRMASVA